jgi:lipoprotein-anchoring transpeptidase ErfK/SrfK
MTRPFLIAAAMTLALSPWYLAPAHAIEPAPTLTSAPLPPATPAPDDEGPAAVAAAAMALKPGDFHWRADTPPDGQVLIAVSVADQKLYAYRNGALFAVSTVSTGKRGHATPRGAFPIMEKRREHYSNLYNNAPMPFMQRLTGDGIALHAGKLPGYPASHGCVRLPLAFAKLLFEVTRRGGMVVVTDQPLAGPDAGRASFDPLTGRPLPSAVPISPVAGAGPNQTSTPASFATDLRQLKR